MSRRSPFVAFAAALVLAAAAPGHAQDTRKTIGGLVEATGFEPVDIAVADADADAGSHDAAAEIVDTVRWDLQFSGYFDVVDPKLYALVPPSATDEPALESWQSIGANALVKAKVVARGGRVDVDVRLYDTPSKKLVLHRRYGGGPDLLRRLAHQISDDITRQLTGRQGISLTWIAFVSKHGEGKEIYLMDYDGRRVRRLTTTGTINLTPAWSPDGRRLAFVSWRGKQPNVYILESDGRLTTVNVLNAELNAAPDWSPDGRRMVYSSSAAGNSDLYVLDLESGRNTRLTATPAIETAPAYSPTGREIAFTSDRSGTPQIYIMDAEGLNVRRVTYEGSYNDSAAWSPRGDKLAYVSRVDGRFDVFVLDIATNTTRRLTFGEGSNENPRWSPDGRHLVFASSRAGTYDIYTMLADGSDVRRLTQGGDCFTPDWSH